MAVQRGRVLGGLGKAGGSLGQVCAEQRWHPQAGAGRGRRESEGGAEELMSILLTPALGSVTLLQGTGAAALPGHQDCGSCWNTQTRVAVLWKQRSLRASALKGCQQSLDGKRANLPLTVS